MKLVNTGNENGKWDDVMTQIAHWLTRHLDDSNLILWVAKHGGQLHPQFARLIRNRLTELHQFIQQNNNAALNHIRTYSPSAIPRPVMRTLWNLVLSGRVSSNAYRSDSLYDWVRHYNSNGLTTTLRLELRDILSSHVRLREPLHWNKADININTSDRLKDLVKWEIALNTEHLHSHYTFNNLQKDAQWVEALPKILPDFNMLLRDILDLKCELNGVNAINDYSYIDQPSISDHPQNNDYNDWTVLIKLTRDAWLTLSKINPDQALLVAEEWYQTPYPIFKRLAFFAATQRNVISTERALKWLLADDAWWLWSPEVLRETIRLLVSLTPELNLTDLSQLEITILKGPPPKMYKEDIEDERWSKVMERAIWLRLSKIKAAGIILSPNSTAELDLISQRNMQWKLLHDDRDEFPFWLDSGDGVEPWCTILDTPTRRIDLVPWLKKHPNTNSNLQDQWEKRCNEKFSTTFCALLALTLEDEWPSDRWREALQGWVSHKQIKRTWHYLGPLLDRAPDDVIQSCARSISWWLLSLSKNFNGSNDLFLKLINRILIINYEDDFSTDNSVNQAINHPIGLVTDALLNWWYRQSPLDNQGLPDNIKQVFTEMCNTKIIKFRYSRVYLATHAVSLFRVDEQWATEYLLPLFDWQVSEFEARIAWESFLYTPRLHRSFLSAIKQPILETVKHYEELGDLAHQYADFLTFAALDFKDVFSISELALATRSLPNDGIASIALALARAFGGSGDQHHEYWQNRVLPYLKSIWPKSREFISPQISQALAKICIEAEEDFPEAFSEIKHWLVPIEWPDFLFRKLSKSILPKQYPKATLEFIDKLIDGNTRWYPSSYLNTCLKDAIAISPDLENDPMYRQLSEYVEKYL